jgi:hypothetical protein
MAGAAYFSPEQLRQWKAFDDLEAKITELWGHLNAATYRFLALVAEFDREQAFKRHGLVSTAQWLNWQCGIGPVAAREKVRVARSLEQLPEIADVFAKGEISYSKVRAMTRVATAANESVLVHVARHGTAAHVEKLVRKYHWTQRRDAAKQAQRQHEQRSVSYFFDSDDEFVLTARLPREIGAVVRKALETAVESLREGPGDVSAETALQIPANARRADALRYITELFLAHHGDATGAGSSGDRVQVVVHIDQAILAEQQAAANEPHRCELEDGPALALDTARRLSCDSTIVGIVEGEDGEPLDIGRKTRSIPAAIARALRARDSGCRFPGCDRTRFCEGHHVTHWANGGETRLDNLITLCGFHHRLVHEGGYGLRRTDDGLFVFTRPDGRRVEENGARCFRGNILPLGDFGPGRAFEDSLRDYLLKHDPGVSITSQTARCQWHGESMNYDQAIEGMQFLERKAAAPP